MVLVVISTILPWHLSSYLVVDENGEIGSRSATNHQKNLPLWTSCPASGETNPGDGDICFVTCIFGQNANDVDQPANVEWFDRHWCHARFLLVTNLPDLPAPGWTRIVSPSPAETEAAATPRGRDLHATNTTFLFGRRKTAINTTRDHIVGSRHAKFLAWEALPGIVLDHCAAIVYMDGYLAPVRYTSRASLLVSLVSSTPWSPASPLFVGSLWGAGPKIPPPPKFQAIVKQVREHPWGLSQVKQRYFDGLPMTTLLRNILRDRKDTKEHVERTLEWFRSQTTDFREIMPYYLNKYFAYDPNNAKYRELSSSFWKTYTTYGGLWRDQPLWAYFLHHFNVTPAVMTTGGTITKGGDLFQKRGTLGWGKHIYT